MMELKSTDLECVDVPVAVIFASELNGSDRMTYTAIINNPELNNNSVKMSFKEIADIIGCSVKTVSRSIKNLVNLKLIDVVKTPGSINEYIILNINDSLLERKFSSEEEYYDFLMGNKKKEK